MGPNRLVWVVGVMAAAFLLGAAPAAGQVGPTVEEVRAWFLKALDEAAEVKPLGEVRLTLEIEHRATASDAQLAEWRREAAGKPQHPLWQQIEIEERRRAAGPDRTRETIWSLDREHWRFNTDTYVAGGLASHLDTASSPQVAWQLQLAHLSLYTADGAGRGEVIENNRRQLEEHLGWILTGGLHTAQPADRGTIEVDVRGKGWEVRLASPKGTTWFYRGIWNEDSDEGRIQAMERRFPGSGAASWSATISGWRKDPVLGGTVAGEVRIDVDGGGLRAADIIRVVEVAQEPRSELLRKLAPPDPLGADIVRGELQVTRVSDYRPGRAASTRYDADTGATLESYSLESFVANEAGQNSWLRILGWTAAVGLVGALAVVQIRKHPRRSLQ